MVEWFTDFKILRQRGKSLENDRIKDRGWVITAVPLLGVSGGEASAAGSTNQECCLDRTPALEQHC